MQRLLYAAALFAAFSTPAAAATLVIDAFDNGVLQGSAISTIGRATLAVTTDSAFDTLVVNATGAPFLPLADLSSVTLDVSSGSIVGTHVLTIDVFQVGVSAPGRQTESTFSVNNLIGTPGPTTESTWFNGTTSSLGTMIASHTFPAGTVIDSVGPIGDVLPTPLIADAQQYMIAFTAPEQSANDTIELTTPVPELTTLAMMMIGFGALTIATVSRRKRTAASLA